MQQEFCGVAQPWTPGDYLMVRLGRNRGPYDCVNAEVYGKNANSEMGDRLGQYCLIDKK